MGWLKALWRVVRGCQWVEENRGEEGKGVCWFRSRGRDGNGNGMGVKSRSEGMEGEVRK